MIDDSALSPDELAVIDAVARIPAPRPPDAVLASFRDRLRLEAVPNVPAHRRRWPLALAAGLVLVLGGGWYLQWRERQQVVTELRTELTAALSDLSEARRFQAITTVGQSSVHDDQIVTALTTAMLSDPNTHVRMAAAEALALVAKPGVFLDTSIKALEREESIFVIADLISLADKMTPLARVRFLNALLLAPHLTPALRAQAESRISS